MVYENEPTRVEYLFTGDFVLIGDEAAVVVSVTVEADMISEEGAEIFKVMFRYADGTEFAAYHEANDEVNFIVW